MKHAFVVYFITENIVIYRRDAFVLYHGTAFVNDGCNPLLTMIVITKKMLMTWLLLLCGVCAL
jgi:hypothetical protein